MNKNNKVLCVFPLSIPYKNMALYQRILLLSREYDLTWINNINTIFDKKIKGSAATIITCKWSVNHKYIDQIIFYVWSFYWLVFKNKHKFHYVYTFHEQSMLAGLVLKKLRIAEKLIIDVLDDPALGYLDSKGYYRFNPLMLFGKLIRFIVTKTKKYALRYANAVITTGIDYKDPLPKRLLNKWDVSINKLLCVPNGVDLHITKPMRHLEKYSVFTVFYVGWVTHRRGVDILINAFKGFASVEPNSALLLVGHMENSDIEWFNKQINGYRDKIQYLGQLESEKVWEQISRSHVCVYPFYSDYLDYVFPVKIFEYLAMGCPVIATDMVVIRHIIKNEDNGLLVEPGNSIDLKNALLKIFQDNRLRMKLSNNARDSVKKYDWRIINKRIINFIEMI